MKAGRRSLLAAAASLSAVVALYELFNATAAAARYPLLLGGVLAAASDFLFVMGYDAHFWDDYTCVLKGTCSPAEASIKDLSLGVTEYLQEVPGDKLVLGL